MNIPIIYGKLENSKVTLTKAEFEKAINDAFEYGKYVGKLEGLRPNYFNTTKLNDNDSIDKITKFTCAYFSPEEIR
jgi:hypothetical protein